MADFDNLAPPKRITNPSPDGKGAAVLSTEYPRHVHHEDGSFVTVENDEQKDAALAQGYALLPFDLSRPAGASAEPVKKPKKQARS